MDKGGLTLHNGQRGAPATISLHDPIVTRGDGCFEAARCYAGVMIGLDDHLERLERSAERMEIRLPSRARIRGWIVEVAKARGDGVVRVFVSADGDGANVYVFSTPLPIINPLQKLLPVIAPWHPAGEMWELAGVKTLSYAPNMGATRTASHAGFDDALLVSTHRHHSRGADGGRAVGGGRGGRDRNGRSRDPGICYHSTGVGLGEVRGM